MRNLVDYKDNEIGMAVCKGSKVEGRTRERSLQKSKLQ